MTLNTSRLIALGLAAAALSIGAGLSSSARAHPHDILAQCQLPDGKWVMCDETIHDTLTNKHVKKTSALRGPAKLTTKPRAR